MKIYLLIGFTFFGAVGISVYWWMVNRYQPKRSIIEWAKKNNYRVVKLSPLAPYLSKFYDDVMSNRLAYEIYFDNGDRTQRKVVLVGGKFSGGLNTSVEVIDFKDK
ncbi:MAG: hypothetical protein OCC49_19255 [Fibrobacterales bacterium]